MNPLLAVPTEFAALLQRFFAERLIHSNRTPAHERSRPIAILSGSC